MPLDLAGVQQKILSKGFMALQLLNCGIRNGYQDANSRMSLAFIFCRLEAERHLAYDFVNSTKNRIITARWSLVLDDFSMIQLHLAIVQL